MVAQKISNLHLFTKQLFLEDHFDSFLVSDIRITTYNTFHIDGSLKREFFTEDEWNRLNSEQFSSWSTLRPLCFSLIKGKKLPISFKIVFRFSKKDTTQLFSDSFIPDELDGLFLNLIYKNEELTCISGTSYKAFTKNREADSIWDQYINNFLIKLIEL